LNRFIRRLKQADAGVIGDVGDPDGIERRLEATLFASEDPMSVDAIAARRAG
jgi:hypothetical protein